MAYEERGTLSNYRIPPDGAGKRLGTVLYQEVLFKNSTIQFAPNMYIRGQTSGILLEIVSVFQDLAATSGKFFAVAESSDTGAQLVSGENILRSNVVVAQVDGTPTDHHIPAVQIVGRNSPFNSQHVDDQGSAFVRFTEGPQQLDSYGVSRMVLPFTVASYNFQYDLEGEDFYSYTVGSASIAHNSNEHSVVLTVDSVSGSRATYTSNIHYPLWPGGGQIVSLATIIGDTGKSGCIRRWGYFNDRNGVFFLLSGTFLHTVERSDVSGAPVDTVVSQSSWNNDPVSAARSADGMILDVSKLNVYWFNEQTMTGGRSRYGVFNENGDRVVVHNEVDLNQQLVPSFRQLNLPFRVEMVNETSTASPSQMKLFGANLKTEGSYRLDEITLSRFSSFAMPAVTLTSSNETYIGSFRQGLLFKGTENRIITVPHDYSWYVSGSAVIWRVKKNPTLTSASFSTAGTNTGIEADMSAVAFSGGRDIDTHVIGPGVTSGEFGEHTWDIRGECMTIRGDGGYGDVFTLTAQRIEPVTTTIVGAFSWRDVG